MTLKYTYKPPLTQFYKLLAIAFAPLHLLNLVSCIADSECSVLTGFYLWLVAECCRQDIDSDHRVVTTDRERKLHQTQGSPPVIIMGKMLNIRSKNQARMIITVSIFFLLCSFTVILNELFPNKKQLRQLRSSDEGLKMFKFFIFTLLTVMCCGFFLVRNVLIVCCFGQNSLIGKFHNWTMLIHVLT